MTTVDARLVPLRESLLQALQSRIPRPKLSGPYRVGLLLVAAVMVLLPLIYLALIGAAGYGLYLHATESLSMFETRGGARGKLFAYLTPLVVGGILLFFMVKPLLAPRKRVDDRVEVDPDEQPFLYEFVGRLCAAVGAPAPRRILLDTRANASAGFHQGGMGIANSGRQLTIGLPLVAGMTVRQLAGVLAHEFGHFSQGAAMRLSFIVSRVNSWFARVVFERDQWDESLVEWCGSNVGYLSIPAYLARGCVWLTRWILYGLMWIGHAVSSNMSRQMEYDADSYKIKLAGSRAFHDAMTRVVEISTAHDKAMEDLGQSWEQRRLAADLPGLVAHRLEQMPDEVRQTLRQQLEDEPTSLFASHPRMVDRMQVAAEADEPGTFDVEAPATVLFDDFERVCRDVSAAHYAGLLGRRFKESCLVANEEFCGAQERSDADMAAAHRVFQGTLNVMAALPVLAPEESADPAPQVRELRDAFVARAPAMRSQVRRLVQLHDGLAQAALAQIWLRAGVRIDAGDFGLEAATEEAAKERSAALATDVPGVEAELAGLCSSLARRLAILAAVSPDLADALRPLRATGAAIPHLVALRGHLMILSSMFQHEPEEKQKAALNAALSRQTSAVHSALEAIAAALGEERYPFEHSRPDATIREVVLPRVPPVEKLEALWKAAVGVDDALSRLHTRLLGRVASLVEEAEAVLRLEPLPEVEADADAAS